MILWEIFLVFLRTGLFAIGGAYSFLPLLEKEVVESHKWLSREEFLEVLGIVKIFPGAISIKFATYVGNKIAGIPGAIVANVANLIAPVVLILVATLIYNNFKNNPRVEGGFAMIQAAVFAMIIAVAFTTINIADLTKFKYLIVIIIAFSLFLFAKTHPAYIIIGAGILGALLE